jgi:hypothetical protein
MNPCADLEISFYSDQESGVVAPEQRPVSPATTTTYRPVARNTLEETE